MDERDDIGGAPGSLPVGRPSRSAAASNEAARARVQSMSRLERMGLALALGRRHAELMRLRHPESAG